MLNDSARRPLKVRSSKYSQDIARKLCQYQVTPNQISVTSVLFALLAAFCLIGMRYYWGCWLLPILAAVFIQCRLLCNLFDGMVAVEGGKATAAGELFNDIPDRIADPLIIVAVGYAAQPILSWADNLGWCAGLLAVLTAYVRTLAVSIGAPTSFAGPMAKQHRMALLTAALVLTALESVVFSQQGYSLVVALIIIALGSLLTCINRARAAYLYLESAKND
ncbi:CDP-alcohol phosphatidyltransferase family protein [Gilvimarinus polysaccharolyticus]|uniref:CDP-alcohol phosphatidyltransferase family protein n=1 Tax=Gilvimarinus polysaccharolyticus TaxID=863921 RepID=UPI0006731C88|nr:CDP-alcohol phosphatidyltransferase family protein [Gilvimarinus polysaccharolyticus]